MLAKIIICQLIAYLQAKVVKIPLKKNKITKEYKENFKLTKNQKKTMKEIVKRGEWTTNDKKIYCEQYQELKLRNAYGVQYFGLIYIGSTYEPQLALFDSGSAYAAINSDNCQGCQQSSAVTQYSYNSIGDSDFLSEDSQLDLQYGTGGIIGNLFQSNFYFTKSFFVNGQSMVDIIGESMNADLYFDALIGIGRNDLSNGIPTVLDNLYSQNMISNNSFSIYLNKENISYFNSEIIFGGVDQSYYTGNMTFIPMIQGNPYYSILLNSINLINPQNSSDVFGSITQQQLQTEFMIVDTGTSIQAYGESDVMAMVVIINTMGQNNCSYNIADQQINCETLTQLFDLQLNFNGQSYILNNEFFILNQNGMMTIQISYQDDVTGILGNVFMQEYYTYFDISNQRIGFASATLIQ